MKNLLSFFMLLYFILPAMAQNGDTTRVGKVVYYEGKVELGGDQKWNPVKINSAVRKDQYIRTTGDAVAEIIWTNGNKSVVGPNSKLAVQSLHAGSMGMAKSKTEGTFTNFRTMFNASASAKRTEEGGIRRSKAGSKEEGKADLYWKSDREISFSEAYGLYESGDYAQAIFALQAFLNQKPKDEMARYASFALGHSYIMSNNTVKAKEIFEKFKMDYPVDPLSAEADKVLVEL
jgi:TolA-binding protein